MNRHENSDKFNTVALSQTDNEVWLADRLSLTDGV